MTAPTAPRAPAPPYAGEGAHALWHVSDQAGIARFEPRVSTATPEECLVWAVDTVSTATPEECLVWAVDTVSTATPEERLVWAVDTRHLPLFWFPRECPRGTFWAGERTTDDDVEYFLSGRRDLRVHAVDTDWADSMRAARVIAYRLPEELFEADPTVTGYWRSREVVTPLEAVELTGLIERHEAAGIELRVVLDLWSVWDRIVASTLEFSGIRLRNAVRR